MKPSSSRTQDQCSSSRYVIASAPMGFLLVHTSRGALGAVPIAWLCVSGLTVRIASVRARSCSKSRAYVRRQLCAQFWARTAAVRRSTKFALTLALGDKSDLAVRQSVNSSQAALKKCLCQAAVPVVPAAQRRDVAESRKPGPALDPTMMQSLIAVAILLAPAAALTAPPARARRAAQH